MLLIDTKFWISAVDSSLTATAKFEFFIFKSSSLILDFSPTDTALSPQFVARMIYDQPEIWLSEYEKFKQLFFICCQTIQITRTENDVLKNFTSNNNNNFVILVPTLRKYEEAGIRLYDQTQTRFVQNNIFEELVPEELTDYEKQYLV